MRKLIISFSILFCVCNLSNAQKQANIWYFGDYAGIDFNSGIPVALTNSSMRAVEGCASIADSNGNILFYTNGDTVWDKSNNVMPNGTGLDGPWSSTQSSLIVPFPADPTRYYIFTTDDAPDHGKKGLRYSVVDMTLNSGLGDITIKNDSLYAPVTEKLTAVRASNDSNIWVIAHRDDSTLFLAYLVSKTGVSPLPVISNIGKKYVYYSGAEGQLKASPDGTKLASAVFLTGVGAELFKFNDTTGVVSNLIRLNITGNACYGTEFSSDNNKVYCSNDDGTKTIYQFDLSGLWDSANINSTQTLIGNSGGSRMGGMQLAPDGKIYVAHNHWTNGDSYLGAINSPDIAGTGCNYVDNSFYLGGKYCYFGLPSFIQSYFNSRLLTKVPSYENSEKFTISPNPFSSSTTILFNKNGKYFLELYNMLGEKLKTIECSGSTYELNKGGLVSGIYMLKFFDASRNYLSSIKLVVL